MIRRSTSAAFVLVLAFVLAFALNASGWGGLPNSRGFSGQPTSSRATTLDAGAEFEAFGADGLGVPATAGCYLPSAITGSRGEIFTLTTFAGFPGEVYSNDGQTLTQCPGNYARISSGTALSSWMGVWVEQGAINLALRSRDLSNNTSWAKTNMTCTRNAVGMRNDANGATTCTATAPNATVCQTITVGASSRNTSWHLKKGTLTGTLTLARDGSTYLADIAARTSSTLWRRAVSMEVAGCAGGNCIVQAGLASSVANPQICLKLANSGDSVIVDFIQDEPWDQATSPIETGVSQGQRIPETAYFTHPPLTPRSLSIVMQVAGTITPTSVWTPIVDMDPVGGGVQFARITTTGSNDRIATCNWTSPTGSNQPGSWFLPWGSGVGTSIGCSLSASQFTSYIRGAAGTASVIQAAPMTTRTYVGNDNGGNQVNGVVKGARVDGTTTAGLWTGASTGTPLIAWLGDSITYGAGSPTARPPNLLAVSITEYVQNFGLSSDLAAGCLSRWRTDIQGKGYTSLILECGVNSVSIGGQTGAQTVATLSTLMDEARADGLRVTVVGIMPWKNSGFWTAPKQVQTDAINTGLIAYAATNSLTYVSLLSMGGQGGDPDVLLTIYNSGDNQHPNAAGSAVQAGLVQSANP